MGIGDTAPSGRISRAAALAATVITTGAALSACSGSSTPGGGTNPGPANINQATDAQIVSALTLTSGSLNAAFATVGTAGVSFQTASPVMSDLDAMGITALKTCLADMDTVDKKAGVTPKSTSVEYFKTASGDKWARSDVMVYNSTSDAYAALKQFGSFSEAAPHCSSPTLNTTEDKTNPYIRGIGNTSPSWYAPPAFSPPTIVVVNVKAKSALSVVAQIRGRFVVVTYTDGSYSLTQSGTYYAVRPSDDTTAVASVATAALSQLTDAVVNN